MPLSKLQWILAAFIPIALGINFATHFTNKETSAFIPGDSSHGHYQIELSCSACHDEDFRGVNPNSCIECHQDELDRANDSHPASKFSDPRNADRLQILDATQCITCHREHQPEETGNMGLTLPGDYCYFCHQDIEENRPSHIGMAYDTCATAGCHNYHDNTALYEDFLEKHAHDPHHLPNAGLPNLDNYKDWKKENGKTVLKASDRDVPANVAYTQSLVFDWADTAHAQAGVNCMDCHEDIDTSAEWIDNPGHDSCAKCHDYEAKTFLEGKHGMRLAQGLSPMTPEHARIPMKEGAAHKSLSCASCHSDHRFDREFASVNACMNCHDDAHTSNYKQSIHFSLWQSNKSHDPALPQGASCATCHLPRVTVKEFGIEAIKVLHNQNETLRPNEKMIRTACMNCHGLEFSIDALADEALIERNFVGRPSSHIESIDMVLKRLEERQSN